jgi:hypothetical protein
MDLGIDFVTALFGLNARHAPAWLYVQDHGKAGNEAVVSFVGASRMPEPHPLRFGSRRPHQFLVAELVVRPHLVVATSTMRGAGIAGLLQADHDIDRMLGDGELLLGAHRPGSRGCPEAHLDSSERRNATRSRWG